MSLKRCNQLARGGFLLIARVISIVSSASTSFDDTVLLAAAQGTAAPIHVWAGISVSAPVLSTADQVDVTFAATNLGPEPIARTAVRDNTVLIVNGERWT